MFCYNLYIVNVLLIGAVFPCDPFRYYRTLLSLIRAVCADYEYDEWSIESAQIGCIYRRHRSSLHFDTASIRAILVSRWPA